jgi:hypothetical protein
MKWSNLPNKYDIRSSFIVVPDRASVLTANQKLCRNNYISERKKIPTDGLQTLLFAGPPRCFAIAGSSDRLRSICSAAHARLRPRWPSIGPSYYGNISQSLLETTPENVGSFHVLETIGGENTQLIHDVYAGDCYKVRSGKPMQENADIAEAMDDSNKSMMRKSSPPPRVYTPVIGTTLVAAAGKLLLDRG